MNRNHFRDDAFESLSVVHHVGGSAFNVSTESLRLGDFTPEQVDALLMQHTGQTGQVWADEAKAEIWNATRGQPWLVNALADEACFRCKAGRDRSRQIGKDAIHGARDRLIQRRVVHLDQLAHKLGEERVRRVIEPLLSGTGRQEAVSSDDLEYVRDLGLIARSDPVAIANPIYREVIPRDLTYTVSHGIAILAGRGSPQGRVRGDQGQRIAIIFALWRIPPALCPPAP